MRAITITSPGGPDSLAVTELPDPEPGPGDVLIDVAAAGINRADLHQRQGTYPPPPGAPTWPGLEVSGTIRAIGKGVDGLTIGDRVCALLPGGGYAELAIARARHVLPVPATVDLIDAAGLPEAVATVWSNLVLIAQLRAGETVLVHGGSSGIGTIAIQLARALGCRVAATAGSQRKLDACARLGADILIDYHTDDFVEAVRAATDGRGVDVILDVVGGDYLERNIRALAPHGRLAIIANQSRSRGSLDIGGLMGSWGSIHASTLRARPLAEKDVIMASVRENAWPLIESGVVVPIIDRTFPLADASLAHTAMETGGHVGKLLLLP